MNNNTIALLVGIFIIISLASFLITPQRITKLTGFATGESSTSFNLTEEVSVLVTGVIDFGSGRVGQNATSSVLDSSLGKYNYYFLNISGQIPGEVPSSRLTDMVFDSDRGVFVIYGGLNAQAGWYNDTWEFNYSSKEWSHIATADAGDVPNGAQGLWFEGMDYDSFAKKVILFGGFGSNLARINQTWAYNGTEWTQLVPDVSPPPLSSPGMAFDKNRNVTVLFGGTEWPSNRVSDTWEYNYSSNNWTNISTAHAPSARESAGLVFISSKDRVYLFGGNNASSVYLDDVWYYDGIDWTEALTSGGPSGGLMLFPVYDSLRDRVLVSAVNASTYMTEFWDFNPSDNAWHRIYDVADIDFVGIPAFESNYNVTVFFVGTYDLEAGPYLNETWIFNYSESGGLANGSWFPYKDYFFVENDGTVNISINFTADKKASQFIGGTNPLFQIKGMEEESGACPDLVTSWTNVPNSTDTPANLCPVLKYAPQESDRFRVPVKLNVPSDVNAGAHNATITFTATKV